jgi:hypothetical protein
MKPVGKSGLRRWLSRRQRNDPQSSSLFLLWEARMAKFNIELRTESHVSETLEVEMKDLTALRVEVARFVGEMLREHASQIWADEDWRIDVTDQKGLILYIMQIQAMCSPATKQ